MEEPDLEHVPAGDTVSSLLISAREGLGLSQKDVADMLFLQLAFIQRIDEGLFQKLPKQDKLGLYTILVDSVDYYGNKIEKNNVQSIERHIARIITGDFS